MNTETRLLKETLGAIREEYIKASKALILAKLENNEQNTLCALRARAPLKRVLKKINAQAKALGLPEYISEKVFLGGNQT